MLRPDERTDVGRRIASGPEAELFCFFHAEGHKSFRDGLLDEEPLDREANLAAIRVATPDGRTGGHLQVRIRENDHGVFSAKFEHGRNQFLCASLGNPAAGGYASCEYHFVS